MESFNARKSRRKRQDVTAFAALIASPAAGSFTMPANGRLKILSEAGCVAGTTMATITGPRSRTIKSPLLAADGYIILDNVEVGSVVDPVANFNVYVDTGMNVFRKVCDG